MRTKECEEKGMPIARVVGILLISIQNVVATECTIHKKMQTNDANICDVWMWTNIREWRWITSEYTHYCLAANNHK